MTVRLIGNMIDSFDMFVLQGETDDGHVGLFPSNYVTVDLQVELPVSLIDPAVEQQHLTKRSSSNSSNGTGTGTAKDEVRMTNQMNGKADEDHEGESEVAAEEGEEDDDGDEEELDVEDKESRISM